MFDDLKADLDPSIKTMLIEKPEAFKLILKRKKNIEDLIFIVDGVKYEVSNAANMNTSTASKQSSSCGVHSSKIKL